MKLGDIGALVLIEWEDSTLETGWRRGDPDPDPTRCRSSGWLIHDGEDVKVLAAHITDDDDPEMAGIIRIPNACIQSITRLTKDGPY